MLDADAAIGPLPGWLVPAGLSGASHLSGALNAGGALAFVHQLVSAEHAWAGTLRQRQALRCAAWCAKIARIPGDEAALRDAHHLTRPGDDPGPAGRLYRGWRDLAARPARLDAPSLKRLAGGLGLMVDEAEAGAVIAAIGGPSPIAAAASAAAAVTALWDSRLTPKEPLAEVLAWMMADAALAAACGWRQATPMLACAIGLPAFRQGLAGRRPWPGDPDWPAIAHAVYAVTLADVYAQAADLARRHERLRQAFARVRSRGGEAALAHVLDDDGVMATSLTGLGSDRAARRFLERLHQLGGLRLLTERATFRIYGL